MEELEKILKQIKEDNIVCPSPPEWNLFYKRIGGFEEEEKSDNYDRHRYFPLVLGGWWPSSQEDKHKRFVNSVEYFYMKYPNKRKFIEIFFEKNENWHRWNKSRG